MAQEKLDRQLDDFKLDREDGSFGYLLKMPMRSLTQEKAAQLEREFEEAGAELERIKGLTPEGVWEDELVEFEEAVRLSEEKRDADAREAAAKARKMAAAKKKKKKKSYDDDDDDDWAPSARGKGRKKKAKLKKPAPAKIPEGVLVPVPAPVVKRRRSAKTTAVPRSLGVKGLKQEARSGKEEAVMDTNPDE